MVALLGPDGRPVRKDVLTEEITAPTLASVRQVFSPDPSIGLTPQALAQLLRAAEEGDAENYLALAERMEEKDLHYLSVLGTRKRAVAQLDIVVDPADEEDENDSANADLVRKWLQRDALEMEIFDILDAVGKGFSVTEIVWETSEKDWQPRELCRADQRWFEIDRVDGRTLRLRESAGAKDLPPYKFIIHNHVAKSGLPIRGGLARIAAWCYLFKNYDIKDWVAFAEIYGQPLRVGKYPPNVSVKDRETLLRAVANIGTDAAAIIPEGMMIEFIKAEQKGSSDLYKDLARFLDEQISKGVLGQTATTEVSAEGGSRALGDVHNEVRGDIRRSDKKQLAATLNRDLIRPFVELNRGPQKAYPRLRLMEPESFDPEKVVKVAGEAAKLGLSISKKDVLRKTGLKEADPEDPDDAIEAPAAPEPFGGEGDGEGEGEGEENGGEKSRPPATGKPNGKAAASRRRRRAVCPVHGVAHGAAAPAQPDSIDGLVDAMMAEWQPAMAPLVKPVLDLAEACASFGEFKRRLPDVLKSMDTKALQDLAARGGFVARLAANTEVDITPKG